jgi:hypothetical protein
MLLILKILEGITILGGMYFSFRSLFLAPPNQRLWKFFKAITVTVLATILLTAVQFYLTKK